MALNDVELETRVAVDLRSWLQEGQGDNPGPRPYSSALERFVGRLVAGHPDWPRFSWVDGVLEDSVTWVSHRGLELRADIVWCDEREAWWLDPMWGAFHLRTDADRFASWQIGVGDATSGLRSLAYGARRPRAWARPRAWLMVFRGPAVAPAT